MTTLTINLSKKFKKSKFWGNTDSDRVKLFLEKKINASNNIINIDLNGIEAFDPLFGEEVFVYIIKFINKYKGDKTLCFSMPQDYGIEYSLKTLLKKNNLCAVLKRKDSIDIAGSVSYTLKVIFNKLYNNSPVDPKNVCVEIGESIDSCVLQFEEFKNMGLARKVENDLYACNFRAE